MPEKLIDRALGLAVAVGVICASFLLRPGACLAAPRSAPAGALFRVAYAPAAAEPLVATAASPAKPTPAAILENVIRNAFSAYGAGDVRAGDALASEVTDGLERTGLEWAALHAPADIGYGRYAAFLAAHPSWPGDDWATRAAEEALWRAKPSPEMVRNFFAHRSPETSMGALALARADLAFSDKVAAAALVRRIWRNDELFPSLETELRAEFGDVVTADDDKARADRLLYAGDTAAALRAAAHAGDAELSLVRIAAAALDKRATPAIMKTAPEAMRRDPLYIFAEINRLEQVGKINEAAGLMLAAPRDPRALIDPDAWWGQRRKLARKLLDLGDAASAYRMSDEAAPGRPDTVMDEQFHAGWIALRFLSNPKTAEKHFAKLAALATLPASKARAEYWLGRTHAALGRTADATHDFQIAAGYPTVYYGQLARVSASPAAIEAPAPAVAGDGRDEAIRAVEFLESSGQSRLALDLAISTAHALTDVRQLEALADVGSAFRDARETLEVGKIAERRGFPLLGDAFPTFGVPTYDPVANSAPPEIVYAIARQESAFRTDATSSAGARGIMQMIISTARRTAQRFKIPFDARRLGTDPAFNARLGAAHLGLLLTEQRGSLILTFAAYNAGGGRVNQWIDAYGDPRKPSVDPVDWVERIPIAETRDYVQRVMENYNVYKQLFAALKGGAKPVASPLPASAPRAGAGVPLDAPLC